MKRVLSALLTAVLLLLCAGCGAVTGSGPSAAAQTAPPFAAVPPPQREVARAIGLGLVPEALQADYSSPVLDTEMGRLLGRVIMLRDGTAAQEWEQLCANSAGRAIDRACGAVYLLCAAQVLGDLRMNALYDSYFPQGGAPWDYETAYCPILPPGQVSIPGPNGTDYTGDAYVGAMLFSFNRCSRLSHRPLMEFCGDWDFRSGEPFTREEAILAAVRLYDSFEDEARYITLEEAGTGSTIRPEALAAAPPLPEIKGGVLPLWKGVGFDSKAESDFWPGHYTRDYYPEEFRFAAEQGFDFFRIMLSFTSLQFPDYPQDARLVNERELEALDGVIAFALQNGVHVQISAFAMPGRAALSGFGNGENYADGAFYPTEQEWAMFTAYWEMLARRYQNIPASYLSFELCSEWHPGDQGRLGDFSAHMDGVVAAIRAISANRLLMAGFDGDLAAAECMAQKGVAISYHCYEPRAFTYVDLDTVQEYGGVPAWPKVGGEHWTAQRVYTESIKPFQAMAQKYGVGFMVGEWGLCNNAYYEECHPQEAAVKAFYSEMAEMFAQEGIPWNHFALAGRNGFMWSGAVSGFGRRGNAAVKESYEYDTHLFEYLADRELLEAALNAAPENEKPSGGKA